MLTNPDALKRARDAFQGSTSYFDANIRPQVERDLRQFQSRHAPDSKYTSDAWRTRSRLFRPKTRASIRKNEAIAAEAFFSTVDTVSITAQNEQDEAQQASAEIMQALLQYRLTQSIPWFQTLMGAYQDAQTVGVVISVQTWEYDAAKGIDRPKIDLIPVENIRYDPGADWIDPINTSPYVIRLLPMYVKDVKARMRPTPDGQPAKWFPLTDAQIQSATRHYDSTRLLREDQRTDSRDNVSAITDFSIVWVHQVILDDDGQDVIYYTMGTEFMLCAPEPLSQLVAHGRRPFVLGHCIIETHKNYPASVARLTRDLQGEINELANSRIDNVKFVLNKRYFVARNKQVDLRSLTRNVPGSITLVQNPETDIKVLDTPDVTASSYNEQDRLNLDFDELSGNFSNSSVQSNRRMNETVGGMEMLSSDASQVSGYQLKTFVETWVEPVLRQLVLLEQTYETDEVILAMAGAKSTQFQRMGAGSVTDELLCNELTLTVNVGLGATSPTKKINDLLTGIQGVKTALEDGVLERYGLEPTEIIKEIFGALGHRDGGRFFKSLGADQDPRLAGLQQQVQQLQQQLDAKNPPEIIAAQVRLINAQADSEIANKVKIGVDSAYAAMQAAEVISSVPQVAPVADKVMQTAGYLRPTPSGIDPNFPTAQTASDAPDDLSGAGIEADQSGATQIAGAGNMIPPSTNPRFPAHPATPGLGERAGIETQRSDGLQNGV